jgi:hypothetical protein
MSKRTVYIFYQLYDGEDPEMYAYTENPELAKAFRESRNMDRFVERKRSLNDLMFRAFMNEYRREMLFWGVLVDNDKSYDFPMTYDEDSELSVACDHIYDDFLELQKELSLIPFQPDIRATLDFITEDLTQIFQSDSKMGVYNTFHIFMNLFGDLVLKS